MENPERQEESAPVEAGTNRGRYWYCWDIPLLGYLLLFGIVEHGFSVVSYIGGLRNDGSLAFAAVLWFVLLLPLTGIFLLLVLVRILVFWPGHVRDRKKLRKLQVGVILGLVIYLGLPFTGLLPPGYKTHTWGFRKHVRANVDVHAIQQWLETVDPNSLDRQDVDAGPDGEWEPHPVIAGLDPRGDQVSLDDAGRPMLELQWGSGMLGTWGVTISHADMAVPETRPRTKEILSNGQVFYNDGQYCLPLAPGAYVWHDIE